MCLWNAPLNDLVSRDAHLILLVMLAVQVKACDNVLVPFLNPTYILPVCMCRLSSVDMGLTS